MMKIMLQLIDLKLCSKKYGTDIKGERFKNLNNSIRPLLAEAASR